MAIESLHKEVNEWACTTLLAHGYIFKTMQSEEVQKTPWSCVERFITDQGLIYLKQTPSLLALEAPITQVLYTQFQSPVPEVIAYNSQLNSFLMKDAGSSLRALLKRNFDVTLLCKAIETFTALQITVVDHIDIFLELGVPDWRLDRFTDLYRKLLAQKDLLKADGVTEREFDELELLQSKLICLCKQLSSYSIPSTLVQPDFHDNNTLINPASQKITLIDLGEVVIAHPFFSLINCLYQAKKHHGLTDKDDAYQALIDASLKSYECFCYREDLLEGLNIARILWFVYDVLAQYRLMNACGKEVILSRQPGKLKASLQGLIGSIAGML